MAPRDLPPRCAATTPLTNISYVVRPSRIPWQPPMAPAIASPILGSKPYSNVHRGSSITPSRDMNSCTRMVPMVSASWRLTNGRPLRPPPAYVTSEPPWNRHPGQSVMHSTSHATDCGTGAVSGVAVTGASQSIL